MNDSIKEKTMRLLEMDYESQEMKEQARFSELSGNIAGLLGNAMTHVSQQLGQLREMLAAVSKEKAELKQIAETNRQILAQMNRSSTVRIGDVMTDSDGRITGATVHTEHGTMQ